MKRKFALGLGLTALTMSVSAMLMPDSPLSGNLRPSTSLTETGKTVAFKGEETAFGRHLLETWQRAGVDLPLPEEQILRMKPGRKKLNAAPEAEIDPNLRFTGFLQYSNVGGIIRLPYGFYTFSPADGLQRKVYKELSACLNGGGVYIDNTLYGMSMIQFTDQGLDLSQWGFYQWDTDTWVENGEYGDMIFDLIVSDADQDPISGKVYGVSATGTLNELDYINHNSREIADFPISMSAFAISNDGVGYGISRDGDLYKINLSNGEPTKVGALDFVFYSALQSMTFDRRTNKCYLAASEGDFENDEMYGRLCEVNLEDATTRLIGYFPDAEEYTVLHILYTPDENAPGAVSDLTAVYSGVEGDANVSFTIPNVTYSGTALTSNVDYSIYVNDATEPSASGSAQPGEKVSATVTPADGRTKYVVVLSNEKGKSERYAIESWGGADNPTVNGLTASYDPETQKIALNWEINNVGEHGGYADMEGVKYSIFRFPGAEMVAEEQTGSSFVDDLSEEPSMVYYYNVIPVRYGRYFTGVKSEKMAGGAPRQLPYSQDFENDDAYSDVWIIDANSDGKTWEVNTDWNGKGAMWNNCSAYHDGDDWAVFPAVEMEEGITYNIHFNASAMGRHTEGFEAKIGEGLDMEAYESLLGPTEVSETFEEGGKDFHIIFSCLRTGAYRLAIHGISKANRMAVVIDNISIEKGYPLEAPDAPANVVVKPFEKGELCATVEFDAPKLSMKGEPLNSISKITLYRGDNLDKVGEITNVTPGAHYSMVDEDAMNGMIRYSVVATNDAGDGQPADASGFVGIDAPTVPTALNVKDNLDGRFTLSWEAPVDGINGGYLDTDELLYTVYQLKDGEPVAIATEIEDTEYILSGLPVSGEQAFNFYFVSAFNDVAESKLTEFPAIISGAPYNLPFMEGFKEGNLASIWRPEAYNCRWYLYPGVSTDDDGYAMGVRIEDDDAEGVLSSGKISLKGIQNPRLVFTFYAYPGEEAEVAVEISSEGEAPTRALVVDFRQLEGEEGFLTLMADLTPYKDATYISLRFIVKVSDCEECPLIVFDDVNVRDVPESNIELSLVTPYKGRVGENAGLNIKIFNVGLSTASDAKVDLFCNGSLLKTLDIPSVTPFSRGLVDFPLELTPFMVGDADIRAELRWNKDVMEADNVAENSFPIYGLLLDAVDKLNVTEEDGKDLLSWDEPSQSETVTDDFESYNPFVYDGFGDWTVEDGDGMTPISVLDVNYPGCNNAAAFYPADFMALGYSTEVIGQFMGHSGSSFVTCVRPSSLTSDDWLISPELSGEGQKISFWAKTLGAMFGETVSVCYSTTGKVRSDFTELVAFDITSEYEEYSVELPGDARYFAFHCTSFFGGMLMIDDVTYAPRRTLIGYKVYCNGTQVAFVKTPETTWSTDSSDKACDYVVTAVYEEGESTSSNKAVVSGVNKVLDNVIIGCLDGALTIKGAEGKHVSIVTVNGLVMANGMAESQYSISLPAGVYLVNIEGSMFKVMIKQ